MNTSSRVLLRYAGVGSIIALLGCAPSIPEDPAALEAIIEAVEQGWKAGNGAPFREHFLDFPGARYIETGGQNEGLTDLIERHVEPESDSFDELAVTFGDVETHFEGAFAWAVMDVEVEATFKDGGQIHRRGHQTFLFRWVEDSWKVVHTHNSTKPVSP